MKGYWIIFTPCRRISLDLLFLFSMATLYLGGVAATAYGASQRWAYPFMSDFTVLHFALFGLSATLFTVGLYFAGRQLNHAIWREERERQGILVANTCLKLHSKESKEILKAIDLWTFLFHHIETLHPQNTLLQNSYLEAFHAVIDDILTKWDSCSGGYCKINLFPRYFNWRSWREWIYSLKVIITQQYYRYLSNNNNNSYI